MVVKWPKHVVIKTQYCCVWLKPETYLLSFDLINITGYSLQKIINKKLYQYLKRFSYFSRSVLCVLWRCWIKWRPHLRRSCNRHTEEITVGKRKAVPLQAWSGPEGSRKLRFPDYMTTAQDGGKVISLMQRSPSPPGNAPGTHFC